MTLQFYSGADDGWRTVMTIQADKREDVLRAAGNLAGMLGPFTEWCILHVDGQRELLAFEAPHARRH